MNWNHNYELKIEEPFYRLNYFFKKEPFFKKNNNSNSKKIIAVVF